MNKKLYIAILFITSFIACDEYLDIEPVGKVIPKSVDDYRKFLTTAYGKYKNHKILATYRGDELSLQRTTVGIEQYEDIFIWNDDARAPQTLDFPYASFYTTIFHANHIIGSANDIEGNTEEVNQLVGEAFALRALQYFDLINIYAKAYNKTTATEDKGVPLVTTYDSEQEYPKGTVQEVYDLILNDITEAEKLLNINEYEAGLNYRFSVLAIKALKAKVNLYMQNWSKAIEAADEAIAINGTLQDLNVVNSTMPSEYNSNESILALDAVADLDLVTYATLSSNLEGLYDKTEDLRFTLYFNENTNGSYNSKKSASSKYKVTLRVSELYLIKTEANWQLGNYNKAKEELIEFTQNRYTATKWDAYKLNVEALNNADLYVEILNERRREFAIEGQRWFDLRRTTQPEITKIYDGRAYTLNQNDARYVIPFPTEAIINNPYLNE